MKCYDFEQMAAFVIDPAKEDRFELVSHIALCSECRNNFELALETLTEKSEPLPGDEQLAKEVVSAFFEKKNAWKRFQAFIENTAAKIQEQVKNGLPFLSTSQLTTRRAQPVFSATKPASFSMASSTPSFSSLPTVTFEAETPNSSDYYWKIQMAFPMMMSENAMITMNVQDKAGKNLTKGTLLFLGKEFPITVGRVAIPFKEFQNNRQCASIGVRFSDGGTVAGSIKFLPESFA